MPKPCLRNACKVQPVGARIRWLLCRFATCPQLQQLLKLRARRHHRSLSQQALSDLQQACGGDPRERRRQALADLQGLADERGRQCFDPAPEELIRQERSR